VIVASVAALGTLILAIATWRLAKRTDRVAKATQADAAATTRAAEAGEQSAKAAQAAVEEVRRDRELDWRPYLALDTDTRQTAGDQVSFEGSMTNVGRGPALVAVFAVLDNNRVALAPPVNIGPGATKPVKGTTFAGSRLVEMFRVGSELEVNYREMAICRDGLNGYWYRFVGGQPAADVWDRTGVKRVWVRRLEEALPQLADANPPEPGPSQADLVGPHPEVSPSP